MASLHVSIAGGRKTMGFYVGYALSLFARDQDRLSHVLVPPSLESRQDFFYPPPPPFPPLHAGEGEGGGQLGPEGGRRGGYPAHAIP